MAGKKQNVHERVRQAVRRFWQTRRQQGEAQGSRSGRRDAGNRTVATGGKQFDGFNDLLCGLLTQSGVPEEMIHRASRAAVTLPGYFRPTKQWDIVVVGHERLLAAVECKALCGPSFGNNYNNRVEEAIGSATDLWMAFREGAFSTTPKPVLAYLLLVEDHQRSRSPVTVSERHFPVFEQFRDASYLDRCAESVRRLLRERCYDVACLLSSPRGRGVRGEYTEPAPDLSFDQFARLLAAQVSSLHTVVARGDCV
ncbi:MAG: restriction endonuclease [Armatimonadia bacterium]|nr:restriction endonuclease [Armatimonadia bacterium]